MRATYLIFATDATDSAKPAVSRRGRACCNAKLIVFVCDKRISRRVGGLPSSCRVSMDAETAVPLWARQKPTGYVYINDPRWAFIGTPRNREYSLRRNTGGYTKLADPALQRRCGAPLNSFVTTSSVVIFRPFYIMQNFIDCKMFWRTANRAAEQAATAVYAFLNISKFAQCGCCHMSG